VTSNKPAPEEQKEKPVDRVDEEPRRRVWGAEAIGLVIIALLILVYALVRYGRTIPWNAR